RRWLASCGLTVEQMQNQMDPVYTPARKIHLYHCDHRGLPLALISTEGATAWCAEYDEWGNLLNEENPHQLQQLIRLPGQQYDEESGLYYNRHRYYDPLQGRYITQDPIGLKGGWNLYGYQLNPISDIDPLGLSMWEDAKSGACTNGLCGTLSAMIGPDKFDSIDSTAYDALNKINSQSICEDKEFAGLICKDNSGRYFSTAPNRGERKGSYPFNSPCPNGTEKVSAYHTHGADSHGEYWDEIFSGKDEKIVKNKAIALELAEIYVKNRYGQDAAEEEKPYEITELTTSWVVEGTIHSDQIAGGVFIIEIGKNDGRILNFGHGK
ncbi:hypothetical protein AZE12_00515, partial [Escherichia coli]